MISVIIPNYNHALYLQKRIESVLHQTFQDFELIILDDCSTDNSREIIEDYRNNPKVKSIVYNQKNSGSPFQQWKKGIELSNGEYIWIAESDDFAEIAFLETLVGVIRNRTNIGICFCGSNWVDDRGIKGKDLSIYKSDFFRKGSEEIRTQLVKHCTIQNVSSALIRKEKAEKYINRALKFRACGDWSLYMDILEKSDILFVSKKLNNFRWYHNNISNNAQKEGLWLKEGAKIIGFSKVYKTKFSGTDIAEIFKFWIQQCEQFTSIRRFKYQAFSIFFLTFFTIRTIIYHSIQRSSKKILWKSVQTGNEQ